jgi:endonuclease YncB( thermonuclease family)
MDRVIRRLTAVFAATVAATTLTAVPAAPASAATVACAPVAGSPSCQVWTGKVAWVADGDTALIDIAGDGTATPVSVRLIGVQAMEQTVYSPTRARRRGECHSLAATARVEQLVKAGGGVVRLTAQHASSISRGRPLRSMAVRINGVWQDIGLDLIRRGHGIALSFGDEWAWDRTYRVAQARAAGDRINLFDTDVCGSGPAQTAALDLWVNSDAEGSDDQNLNGEWIRVGNNSSFRVPVGGWWVRDSGLRRYTFPAGTVLPARGAVYVHVGKGTATATHKYWGLTTPIFENATTSPQAAGDGAYLFDPRGDMRSWTQYPCVLNCTSRLAGKVAVQVDYASVEEVRVVNTSAAAVDLYRHVLVSRPYLYPFTTHTVLQPGEVLRLRTTAGTNTASTRYWGRTGSILNNTGDGVSLRTAEETIVACVTWGSGTC